MDVGCCLRAVGSKPLGLRRCLQHVGFMDPVEPADAMKREAKQGRSKAFAPASTESAIRVKSAAGSIADLPNQEVFVIQIPGLFFSQPAFFIKALHRGHLSTAVMYSVANAQQASAAA